MGPSTMMVKREAVTNFESAVAENHVITAESICLFVIS